MRAVVCDQNENEIFNTILIILSLTRWNTLKNIITILYAPRVYTVPEFWTDASIAAESILNNFIKVHRFSVKFIELYNIKANLLKNYIMYIEDNSFENNNRANDLTYIYLYAQVSSLIILILNFTLLLTIGTWMILTFLI